MDYRDYLAMRTDDGDLLDSWRWLVGSQLRFWHATSFADVLLKDSQGAVHFLDTIEGTVARIASSEAEFAVLVRNPELADQWLMAGLVDGAARRGMKPGAGECLCFKVPPMLGGTIDLDNVEVFSLEVALSINGQIVRQVKDLPPGTKINAVRMTEDAGGSAAAELAPKPSTWWRRLWGGR
jgi:hypothetical protein